MIAVRALVADQLRDVPGLGRQLRQQARRPGLQ